VHVTAGCFQVADTLLKVAPVALYPAQFVLVLRVIR
jgi:hypothetical protein